jgi:TonB family protein
VLARWNPYDVIENPSFQSTNPPRPTTVLAMRIGPDGRVSDLRILRPSGIPILDERALAAVRATAPLPPPPLALRDASGMVAFDLGFRVYRTTDKGDPREDEKQDNFAVIFTAPASDPPTKGSLTRNKSRRPSPPRSTAASRTATRGDSTKA